MPYPAAAIANEFLELARAEGRPLTPMHIQKLIYFAHGWNLALTGEPLIRERVEAWDYGPVIRALYGELKVFGSGAITKNLLEPEWTDGGELLWRAPSISGSDSAS